jgi:hypothetical protein
MVVRAEERAHGMEAKVSTTSDSQIIEDARIGVRLKISALWVAMLFLFAYGDIFGFFVPGRIDDIRGGEVSRGSRSRRRSCSRFRSTSRSRA